MKGWIITLTFIVFASLGLHHYVKAHQVEYNEETIQQIYTQRALKKVPQQYHGTLRFYSAALDIPLHVLANMGTAESEWNERAVGYNRHNNTYDIGLFQLNSNNYENFSKMYLEGKPLNPYNPKHSIHCGANFLASMIEAFDGDIYLALCAYNYGIGNVKSDLKNRRPFPDCVNKYARKILGEI